MCIVNLAQNGKRSSSELLKACSDQVKVRNSLKYGVHVVKISMGAGLSTCFHGAPVCKPGTTIRSESELVTSLPSPNSARPLQATSKLPGIAEEEDDNHLPKLLPPPRSTRKPASKGLGKTRSQYHVSPRIC